MKYTEKTMPPHLRLKVKHYHDPRGQWCTAVWLYEGETRVASGLSICNPKDNPSRKVGRAIAVGRALKHYHCMVGSPREWGQEGWK